MFTKRHPAVAAFPSIWSAAFLCVTTTVTGQEAPLGSWELTYLVGNRQRPALLVIAKGAAGRLGGFWTTQQRGKAPIRDVEFDEGKLSFKRTVRLQGRDTEWEFRGQLAEGNLTGVLSGQNREIAVKGTRAKPGAAARLGDRKRAQPDANKPTPTHRNVAYDTDERTVMDVWLAQSDAPTPLALYIHGGGFRGGSKNSITAGTLKQLLSAGISVASVEYRLVPTHPLPTAHNDSRRALQFLRAKAEEWNIDKTRVGAFGGSAGAQLCMWLAFHDDMADPASEDPIEHESTRLTCVATNGGQTTMDREWWMKLVPGYDAPHRDPVELYGQRTTEEIKTVVEDISALDLISADDPPIYMQYGQKPDDPVPDDPGKARGWKIHHVIFGIKLKERMDALGVEAILQYPGAETRIRSRERFFIEKLAAR